MSYYHLAAAARRLCSKLESDSLSICVTSERTVFVPEADPLLALEKRPPKLHVGRAEGDGLAEKLPLRLFLPGCGLQA